MLDLELAYDPVFTADRGALLRAGLGLTQPGADTLVAAHGAFFADTKFVDRLKKLLLPNDDLVIVQAKMTAVAIGHKEHSFSEITRALLIQHAQDEIAGWDTLTNLGLAEFYWTGAEHIYGYLSEAPTVAGFVLWMFQQARDGFDVTGSKGSRNLAIDFRSFRDSKRSASAIKTLARKAEENLGYRDQVAEISWGALSRSRCLRFGRARGYSSSCRRDYQTYDTAASEVLETIGIRRHDSFWFEDYATLYEALAAAAELLPTIRTAQLDLH